MRTGQLGSGMRSSLLPADYLVEINKVLFSVDDVELSLNTPELSTIVYDDFSFQEDSLKVNLQALHLNVDWTCRWHNCEEILSPWHLDYGKI